MRRNSKRRSQPKSMASRPSSIIFPTIPGGVYLPDCLPLVKAIAARGFTDSEMCDIFSIDKKVFAKWKSIYPDFGKAIETGRLLPDAAVITSLFQRAVGYNFLEDGLTKTGKRVSLERHLPGDVGAIRYWLNNRQRDHWKDRSSQEIGGNTDKDAKPIGVKSEGREEMITAILALVQPKPDNVPSPEKPK